MEHFYQTPRSIQTLSGSIKPTRKSQIACGQMKPLPTRTGVTDLSDDELLLFDFLWWAYVPRRLLDSRHYAAQWNVGYTHSLNYEDLCTTLQQLLQRQLVQCKNDAPDLFTLTSKGAALWEMERQPDWERYVCEHGSHNEQRLSLVALNETTGRRYIGAMFSAGLIVPTGHIRCRTIRDYWITPSKRCAVAQLLRVNIRGDEQMRYHDWKAYESGRDWWRSIIELNTLAPKRRITNG